MLHYPIVSRGPLPKFNTCLAAYITSLKPSELLRRMKLSLGRLSWRWNHSTGLEFEIIGCFESAQQGVPELAGQ